MKYKTEYPAAYHDGIVNRSFSISKTAYDLLDEAVDKGASQFVNDLIIEALQEKGWQKRKAMSQLNAALEELRKNGVNFRLEED